MSLGQKHSATEDLNTSEEEKLSSPSEVEKIISQSLIDEGDYQITAIPPATGDSSYQLHIIDKKTGKIVNVLDEVETIQFLDPSLKVNSKERKEWEKAVSTIQNFSAHQLVSLKNVLNEMGPIVQRTAIVEAIQSVVDRASNKDTFALPSHALMFTLLAMFAGKPENIPRRLLTKPHTEWNSEEKKEAEEFFSSLVRIEKKSSYLNGKEETEAKVVAVISDNPKVEAEAEISSSIFKDDIQFREISLAIYIKRTFGAEGLRHLLGFLIGLEENFRKGDFEWSVNEHLERLGYRRQPNGTYATDLKKTASEIIKIFQSLFITARKKEGKKEVIRGERLFSIESFRQEIFDKVIIDERIKLRATDFWYKNAFEPKDGQSAKYTKLLKKIAQENHREHPLTIYLAPLLAIFWRMNPEQKISVCSLMDWCDLDHQGKYKRRNLRNLESELNYMKEQGYLGNWTSTGDKVFLSECSDPFNSLLTLTPPQWLEESIKLIQHNKELPDLDREKEALVTIEDLRNVFKKSGLNVRQFGNHLGISGSMVSFLLNGKRQITKEHSEKIKLFSSKLS